LQCSRVRSIWKHCCEERTRRKSRMTLLDAQGRAKMNEQNYGRRIIVRRWLL